MTAAHECETFSLSDDEEDPICLSCGHYTCTRCKATHALSGESLCASCLGAVAPGELDEATAVEAAYRQALVNLAAAPSSEQRPA